MKKSNISKAAILSVCALAALFAFAKQEKVVQVFRNGEVIREYKASEIDYIEVNDVVTAPDGIINGHSYVDLGLPSGLKWATCNVGASTLTGEGDFFAWGETSPKSSYTESNSKTYGKNFGDISGSSNYDAARANWGATWRMPSSLECQELIEECIWTWTTKSGITGYEVTGPNGKAIFLPAAGYRYGTSHYHAGSYGNYWISTPKGTDYAYGLEFDSGGRGLYSYYRRSYGQSVRAVSE